MRKGQAALEFLMTYGWAILVVLAAIAALAYFGVLSPDRFLPSKCTVTGGFSCVEYKVDGTAETVTINIQNNLGVDADLVAVQLITSDCTLVAGSLTPQFNAPLANGAKTGLITYTCTAATLGSKLKGDVVIDYTRAGETVSHQAMGTISSQAE
jgi:hypothetical protein